MAASLSRPDPSSPASVAEAAFSTSRRGFNPDEVRAFLVSVAAEMGRLSERERQLEAELREARTENGPVELDDETVARLLGEETLRVLQTARESASEIKVRAEEKAAQLIRGATDEANRLRQDAEVEAARRRQDAQADAEAEVALAKQQGREMVTEAREYRERVLADLDRRTTLAKRQIEELMGGRDRLLQVFERARLVAVDVTSGLGAIEAPDELVNLTPTTGPVPVMVPNQRRPDEATDSDIADIADDDDDDDEVDEVDEADAADEAADTVTPDAGDETPDGTGAEEATDADDAETAEADAETGKADEVADADEADDADTAEGADRDETSDADDGETSEPAQAKSDNVVSLFGDRAEPHEAAAHDDHPSVDDIFERLRHETVDEADTDPADTDAAAVGADAVETGPAETEADAEAVETGPAETETETDADADADAEAHQLIEPTAFGRRDEALVPLIVAGARRLKRVLADEQNEALDMLRQSEPVESLDAVVPLLDEHVATYTTALAEELAEAAAAGATEAGARNNKTTRNKLVKAGALDRAHEQVQVGLVAPLRERLVRAIHEGDGDNEVITKRVRAVYREWKTQHIDTELDDVFRCAFSAGLVITVEPGTSMVWTIDPSAVACPDCEDNSLAGTVPAGDEFPTGHAAPPAHPGCRCLALPAE